MEMPHDMILPTSIWPSSCNPGTIRPSQCLRSRGLKGCEDERNDDVNILAVLALPSSPFFAFFPEMALGKLRLDRLRLDVIRAGGVDACRELFFTRCIS